MRPARFRVCIVAAALLVATLLPPPPAVGLQRAGPCDFPRLEGETTRRFMKRVIACATDTWSVPGGAPRAICIARRESGLHPRATSKTGVYLGLYQHAASMWPDRYTRWARPEWALDASALSGRTNAIVTIRMVHAHGWGPWKGPDC